MVAKCGMPDAERSLRLVNCSCGGRGFDWVSLRSVKLFTMVPPILAVWRERARLPGAELIETGANDRKVAKRNGRG